MYSRAAPVLHPQPRGKENKWITYFCPSIQNKLSAVRDLALLQASPIKKKRRGSSPINRIQAVLCDIWAFDSLCTRIKLQWQLSSSSGLKTCGVSEQTESRENTWSLCCYFSASHQSANKDVGAPSQFWRTKSIAPPVGKDTGRLYNFCSIKRVRSRMKSLVSARIW